MTATAATAAAAQPIWPSTLVVHGGRELGGAVEVAGFKHAMVTGVAAACLGAAPVRLRNCPAISETDVMVELLRGLGVRIRRSGTDVTLDAGTMSHGELDGGLVGAAHGAVYLAPALIARFGRFRIPPSGGCPIGDHADGRRPVEHYVTILERFGASGLLGPDGSFEASAESLRGCEIDLLDFVSDRKALDGPHYSGASKMALLTAAVATGTSVLRNLYAKPDVLTIVELLHRMGGDVDVRDGGREVVVHGDGGRPLVRPAELVLPPDLIEIMTWICVGATTSPRGVVVSGGDLVLAARVLAPELELVASMGVDLDVTEHSITARAGGRVRPVDVVVAGRGIFSDNHPLIALLAARADGVSTIVDTVWRKRFGYVPPLASLGMHIEQRGNAVRVAGPWRPSAAGRRLEATDLRAAAVLVLAALQVRGTTTITGCEHLGRGYADLPRGLVRLGAELYAP